MHRSRRRTQRKLLPTLLLSLALPLLSSAGTTTSPADLNTKEFDYVIVGGGTAGLAVAARLSENSGVSVAVIEAGTDGSEVMQRILLPAMTYLEGVAVPNATQDWNYFAQSLNRTLHWPRGKILGGSSAINALYVVRASKAEHDAWASLNPGAPQDWSWDNFYPWMRHVEDFTRPSDANATFAHITVDDNFHSAGGPIHSSFPDYTYDSLQHWVPTLGNLGIPARDPQGGAGGGVFITPNTIDPVTQSRSYSKTGYLDPAGSRSNLVVLLGHQATKIGFTSASPPAANSVQFQPTIQPNVTDASGNTGPGPRDTFTVTAKKEVILCGGVVGTPQLLQLSGVGPKDVLATNNITMVAELPGVGQHVQDHVLVNTVFTTTAAVTGDLIIANQNGFRQQQLDLYAAGDFGDSLYSAPNNGIAYVSLKQLLASSAAAAGTPTNDNGTALAAAFVDTIKANLTSYLDQYTNLDPNVRNGYELTYTTELNGAINSDVGVIEILLSNTGSFNTQNKTLQMQASLQHPFSRGSIIINGTDPFQAPFISPNYLNHDADRIILREGLKFARRIAQTAPLSSIIVEETQPGKDVVTDDQLDAWIIGQVATQYHPASSASQLPIANGGVVDTELKVYGVSNLRVIDSSIIPIGLCAHLMWPTFAIAEKGAAIITGASTPALVPLPPVSKPGSTGAGAALRGPGVAALMTIVTIMASVLFGSVAW